MTRLHAIIPAGGAGTRLWPLSRRDHPKFLHDLTGSGRSLLQATVDRLETLTDSITVVTGTAHAAAVRHQLPHLPAGAVLAEPSPRDSMAAIGLAAAVLADRHPDEQVIIGSFAADHVITDDAAFGAAVRTAMAAAGAGHIATIGIEPTGPATGFGYIEAGAVLPQFGAGPAVHGVRAFTEKPDAGTAAAYLDTGRYWWNAGMFVVAADVLLDHLAREQPDLAAGLQRIAAAWSTPQLDEVLARRWPALRAISIDHAIAEPVAAAGGVVMVPATFGWDDVGDWAALRYVLPPAAGCSSADPAHLDAGLRAPAGAGAERSAGDGQVHVLGHAEQVLSDGAPGAVVVPGTGRTVVLLGIPDAVVVDTPDALLVTTTAHAQQVKDIVAALHGQDHDHLL